MTFDGSKKNYILVFAFLAISTLAFGQDESSAPFEIIPTKSIMGDSIKSFIDSLTKRILADTSLFKQDDLWNINNQVENKKDYSALYFVNLKCEYKLDIINGNSVKEFIQEFFDVRKIEKIYILNSIKGEILFGDKGKNGIVLILTKKNAKLNYKVAGLRRLYKKRKNANFNELLPDKPSYYY